MEINADFSRRAIVHAGKLDWSSSPMPGVERRMLDRIGDEIARATSIVRYAPGSHFAAHTHGGGEEFLVLEGTFSDETGDFPTGWYVRNPPMSQHTPRSEPGCVIFVKLWQFDANDRTLVRLDTALVQARALPGHPEVSTRHLFEDSRECVRLEHWPAGARFKRSSGGGLEALVIVGSFSAYGEDFHLQSWLRLPSANPFEGVVGPKGCTVWTKAIKD